MAGEGPLAFAAPGLPDLRHGVVGARDDAERVPDEPPDAFDVAKHAPDALPGRGIPETHGVVQAAGKHVPGGERAVLVAREAGAVRHAAVDGIWRRLRREAAAAVRRLSIRVVVDVFQLVGFKVCGHEENLLHLADMALVRLDAVLRVQVP